MNSVEDIDFIVDSSKDPLWLMDQIRYNQDKNYKIVPVLIYKTPLEYFYSIYKRDKNSVVNKGWIRRHQQVFYATKDFISVNYKELTVNPSKKVKSLCKELQIEYFKGKKNFWINQHSHFLFGSGTVKNSDRHISYKEQYDEELLDEIKSNFSFDGQHVENILQILRESEVSNYKQITDKVKKLKEKYSNYRFPLRLYNRIKSTPFYCWNSNFKD